NKGGRAGKRREFDERINLPDTGGLNSVPLVGQKELDNLDLIRTRVLNLRLPSQSFGARFQDPGAFFRSLRPRFFDTVEDCRQPFSCFSPMDIAALEEHDSPCIES